MPVGMVPATLVLYENDKRPVEDDTSLFGAAAFYNNTAVTAAAFLPPMCDLDTIALRRNSGERLPVGS